ncbi:hypothetical protein BDR07DRAFT_1445167 [Suillus spraguei]|nr:hypothetical protein BDR07DRAFT_1445167 [Suillus spraguei]
MPFLRYLKAASAGPHAVFAVLKAALQVHTVSAVLPQVLMPFLRYLKLLLQVLIPFLRYLKAAFAGPHAVSAVLKAASAGPHAVSAVLKSCFCRSLCRFCGT